MTKREALKLNIGDLVRVIKNLAKPGTPIHSKTELMMGNIYVVEEIFDNGDTALAQTGLCFEPEEIELVYES